MGGGRSGCITGNPGDVERAIREMEKATREHSGRKAEEGVIKKGERYRTDK